MVPAKETRRASREQPQIPDTIHNRDALHSSPSARSNIQLALGSVLRDLGITVDDVADFVNFEDDQYARNLTRAGEHYNALLLCWRSGQRTPIHNHPGAVGGVRVMQGTVTETLCEFTPRGADLAKPLLIPMPSVHTKM